jgi:ADP-ribosylglycohydrolase
MTHAQEQAVRAAMAYAEAIFEGLTQKLVDTCPEGVSWEDHDPDTDRARAFAHDALATLQAVFPHLHP